MLLQVRYTALQMHAVVLSRLTILLLNTFPHSLALIIGLRHETKNKILGTKPRTLLGTRLWARLGTLLGI